MARTAHSFFCSFADPDLIEAVRRGRRDEFAALAFTWQAEIPDPQAPETLQAALLSWHWPPGTPQAGLRSLYAFLLHARREWPALRDRQHTAARYVPAGQPNDADPCHGLLVLQRGGEDGLVAIANLSDQCQSRPPMEPSRRALILSTEEARFGGRRDALQPADPLLPYELQIWGDRKSAE